MSELLISFSELEKQFILLNIFMKLRNKITEDMNERNKPYLMLYGLNAILKSVIPKNCSSTEGDEVENWNSANGRHIQ